MFTAMRRVRRLILILAIVPLALVVLAAAGWASSGKMESLMGDFGLGRANSAVRSLLHHSSTRPSAPASVVDGAPTGVHQTDADGAGIALASVTSTPRVNCARLKCVALTFDDGPGPYTMRLLDELDAAHVKATFFEIGQNVAAHRDVVRRQVADGMVIGNHTWDHKQLTALGRAAQQNEVARTTAALVAAGAPRPSLLRPPYGSFNSSTRALGYSVINWDVDSEDWKNRNAATTTALIMKEVRPGSIVLMHDIQPSSVRAVPRIIALLRARGYTLVTVPQLIGRNPVTGKVYFRR